MTAKRKNKSALKNKVPQSHQGIMQFFFVAFFIVLIPLIYSKSTIDPVVFPRFLALAVGLFILVVALMIRKSEITSRYFYKSPVISLCLFILLSAISLFFAINPVEGLADLQKWLLVFLIIGSLFLLDREKPGLSVMISKGVVISASIAVLIGFFQYFNDAFQNSDPNALYEVSGLMAHKNQFSISLFLMLPFLVYSVLIMKSVWKKAGWFAVAGSILMIAILQTRAVWIAFLFSVFLASLGWFYIRPLKKYATAFSKISSKLILIFVMLFIIAGAASFIFSDESPVKRISSVFDTQNTSNEWRIEMWIVTLDLVKDYPVIGVGGGNWKIAVYPYYGRFQPSVFRQWRNPHNDFLLVSAEKGIPALLLYLLFYITLLNYGLYVFRRAKNYPDKLLALLLSSTIPGFLVISFFSFPTERMNHLLYLGVIAGLIIAIHDRIALKRKSDLIISRPVYLVPILFILGFAIYFGINTVQSEYYIAKAQKLKERANNSEFARNAELGFRPLVPFEPRYSFPVVNYKGLGHFIHNQDYQTALKYFMKAYQQHPTNFAVINNVGSVYGQMGKYDSSIVYYQKTLDIFSHYDQGLLNTSKAWYLKENYRQAYFYILCCDPKNDNPEIAQFRQKIEQKLN